MRNLGTIAALALLLALAGLVMATRRDFGRRNRRLFHSMVDSPAQGSQSAPADLGEGPGLGPPPKGTIPRGFTPFAYPDGVDARQTAGRKLQNPLESTSANLERGRLAYENFCSHCHGARGRGDGAVARRTVLSMSLVGPTTRKRGDGELFHIITYGRLTMPAHAPLVLPQDRWRIIQYVRRLQEDKEKAEAARAREEGAAEAGPGW